MEQKNHFIKNYGLQIGYVVLLTACLPLNLLYFQVVDSLLGDENIESQALFFSRLYMILVLVYIVAVIVLGIINIVRSFQAYRRKDISCCINGMLILKYGLVVFFVVNFLMIVLAMAGTGLIAMVATRGIAFFALPFMLPGIIVFVGFLAFVTWLALVPGAFYGISVIRLSYREKRIGIIGAIFHAIFQFTFLADVLDSMYLSVAKWGRGKKSAVIIAIVYLISAVGIIWAVVSAVSTL